MWVSAKRHFIDGGRMYGEGEQFQLPQGKEWWIKAGLVEPMQQLRPRKAKVVEATDSARQLAMEHGLPLNNIDGTGKGGRIIKADVQRALP